MSTLKQIDPVSLHRELKKRNQSLKRRKFSPYYRDAFILAGEISDIVGQARALLLPDAPELAWDIIDILLKSDKKLLYAVDDSSGAVGGEFGALPKLWIEAAERAGKDSKFWQKELLKLTEEDEWGFRGEVLALSVNLVGKEYLEKLADEFKAKVLAESEKLSNTGDFFERHPIMHTASLLMCCATALEDPFLYEEGMRLQFSCEPQGQQALEVAGKFVDFKQYAQAEKRLVEPAMAHFDHQRIALLKRIYHETGQDTKLRDLATDEFRRSPDRHNLKQMKEHLPPDEFEKLQEQAFETAKRDPVTSRAVGLLIEIGAFGAAEELLIDRQESLSEGAYPWVLNILAELEQANSYVGAMLCYRALLLDILDRSFYKGYVYAARYFRASKQLDKIIEAYPAGVPDHLDFVALLRERHGKKTSFWKRVST